MPGHLQSPDSRDKALAGRLATGLNHRLLDGLTREEILLLRAWLLQAAVEEGCEHWWRAQSDPWTRQMREASLQRAFRLGALTPFAERSDPTQRRASLLADVLRYRLIAWSSPAWPDGIRANHQDTEARALGNQAARRDHLGRM